MNTTKISNETTFESRVLYGTIRALEDLLLTIPYHPEKTHLLSQVEAEREQVQTNIDEWWNKVSKETGIVFSDNAYVRFDQSIIVN